MYQLINADGSVVATSPAPIEYAALHAGWRVNGTVIVDAERAMIVATDPLWRIDHDVDALYAEVVGHRASEYEEAERQAQGYAAAGYAGDPPPMVAAWATAKAWSGQRAADDIIDQATAWRAAQVQIRAARLARKEQVRRAGTPAAIAEALAAWQQDIGALRAALGIGG